MPKGPNGERRPADVVGMAIKVARISTGEIKDELPDQKKRKAGIKGGNARAAKMKMNKTVDTDGAA